MNKIMQMSSHKEYHIIISMHKIMQIPLHKKHPIISSFFPVYVS